MLGEDPEFKDKAIIKTKSKVREEGDDTLGRFDYILAQKQLEYHIFSKERPGCSFKCQP